MTEMQKVTVQHANETTNFSAQVYGDKKETKIITFEQPSVAVGDKITVGEVELQVAQVVNRKGVKEIICLTPKPQKASGSTSSTKLKNAAAQPAGKKGR